MGPGFNPFDFLTSAAGGGGIQLSSPKHVQPTAVQSGDLTGPVINFGSSAPGITTMQIALLAGAVLGGLWIVKKVK